MVSQGILIEMPFSCLAGWISFIEHFWVGLIEQNDYEDRSDLASTEDFYGDEGTLVKAQMNSLKKRHAYCCEKRPINRGMFLVSWEGVFMESEGAVKTNNCLAVSRLLVVHRIDSCRIRMPLLTGKCLMQIVCLPKS